MQVNDSRVFTHIEREVKNQLLVRRTPTCQQELESSVTCKCLRTFIQITWCLFKYRAPKYTQADCSSGPSNLHVKHFIDSWAR